MDACLALNSFISAEGECPVTKNCPTFGFCNPNPEACFNNYDCESINFYG